MCKRLWNRFFRPDSRDNLKSKTRTEPCRRIQNRKWVGIFAIILTFVFGGVEARAQQPVKIPRIGYLNTGPRTTFEKARTEAFQQGLRELGYVEEKNIVIEWRYADGKADRLRELAAELV
jgi:hypothetical protein